MSICWASRPLKSHRKSSSHKTVISSCWRMYNQGPASSLNTTKTKFSATTSPLAIRRSTQLLPSSTRKQSLSQCASSERNASKTKSLKTAFFEKLHETQALTTARKLMSKKSVLAKQRRLKAQCKIKVMVSLNWVILWPHLLMKHWLSFNNPIWPERHWGSERLRKQNWRMKFTMKSSRQRYFKQGNFWSTARTEWKFWKNNSTGWSDKSNVSRKLSGKCKNWHASMS